MIITIELETENAAFEDGSGEAARLVQVVADRFAAGQRGGRLMDINGNRIGTWEAE